MNNLSANSQRFIDAAKKFREAMELIPVVKRKYVIESLRVLWSGDPRIADPVIESVCRIIDNRDAE